MNEAPVRELRVFVGTGLDEEALTGVLAQGQGAKLKDVAHALLVGHSDDGAMVHSVEIQNVTADFDSSRAVHIEFETSWSIYKGCDDRNLAGNQPELETAEYTHDGFLVFYVPMPRRPSNPC